MKYVVLVSHGGFAEGLKTTLAMFTGEKIEQVIALGLKQGKSVTDFAQEFRESLAFLNPDDSVIVLADIVGGSPLTTACSVLEEMGKLESAVILGGMNFPMALTAVMMKDSVPAESLAATVLPEAQAALQEFKVQASATSDDEEDDI